jgi:preprotein translocase subunit SecE
MDAEKITTSVPEKVNRFFKEVKAELKKVTWTGKKEVTSGTIAVIILSTIISVFLTAIDAGLSYVVKIILGAG